MLSSSDQFINISRLNFAKYAQIQYLAKPLFEYIFHHENDLRNALQLATLATEACQFNDWWWKVQLGKCYFRLVVVSLLKILEIKEKSNFIY